jgi:hypothetical protein
MDALEQYTFEQFVDMVDNIFISTKIETIWVLDTHNYTQTD